MISRPTERPSARGTTDRSPRQAAKGLADVGRLHGRGPFLATFRGSRWSRARAISQTLAALLFIGALFLLALGVDFGSAILRGWVITDPLVLATDVAANRTVNPALLFGLVPLALAILLGRAYCGWACPLGAIHQLVTALAWPRRQRRRTAGAAPSRLRFVLLILALALAAAGSRVGSLLDPIPLLARGTTPLLAGTVNLTRAAIAESGGANDPPTVASSAATGAAFVPPTDHAKPLRLVEQPLFVGLLLLAVLLLNLFRPRYFCTSVCPLGGLLSVASRIRVTRLRPGAECTGCRTCETSCPNGAGPGDTTSSGDCLACFACADRCPSDGVALALTHPDPASRRIDIGRRRLVGATLGSLFAAAGTSVAPELHERRSMNIRPPGALPEETFLRRCLRCGACVQACPTGFIQPAGIETGIDGLWTPVATPGSGYCDWSCKACTEVCPTGAIESLSLQRKQRLRIGTAVIDHDRCFTHGGGFDCTVCHDACPVPGPAIRFTEIRRSSATGLETRGRAVEVIADLCTGCGVCVHVCPRTDQPGITIGPDGEDRRSRK